MTDDRKNIKVDKEKFQELKEAKEMSWGDQILHWKRLAETKVNNNE